jgi:hypothetical protein
MGFKVEGLDQTEAWAPQTLLPVGWHDVTIEEAEDGTSTNGFPQVRMKLSNDEGEIQDWLVYTESTKGKFVQVLEAVGIVPGSGEWEFPTERLVGKPVAIKVGKEPDFKDPTKDRHRVQGYAAVKNGGGKKSDDDLPF